MSIRLSPLSLSVCLCLSVCLSTGHPPVAPQIAVLPPQIAVLPPQIAVLPPPSSSNFGNTARTKYEHNYPAVYITEKFAFNSISQRPHLN